MRALLDVNIIIALLDPDHSFHKRAHDWWGANTKTGWASCPLTQTGAVRVMSNPGYRQQIRFTPVDLISRLQLFANGTDHEFWPDDISWLEKDIFATDRIHSSRQLTDLYLLALAAKHGGKLATFDRGISISGVRFAKPENLCVV